MPHRPFSELTKHFTAEDWAIVNAETERIAKQLDESVTPAHDEPSVQDGEPVSSSRMVSAKGSK